ncbi:Lon protease family protein [Ammoniphilus oxalaticus]|uniref:Lon protease family protein n=1 Tax=Ammoniphilus oxalaticus TaxID=66863 RepID=UPI000E752D64|nr:ATP-binding protein [Ammoniphilus oxalaticus]
MKQSRQVPAAQLRGDIKADDFPFETTNEIESLSDVVFGQKRAERASEFGLKVKQPGYNLFLVGPSGSGKSAYALAKVTEMAEDGQAPNDWCYVYNFESPDHPLAISFPAGQAAQFKQTIETLIKDIERNARAAFASEEFEKKRKSVHKTFNDQAEEIWKQLEQYAKDQNFGVEKTQQGYLTVPLRFGRPISKEEFKAMPEAEQDELNQKGKEVEAEVTEAARRIELVERQLEEEYDKLKKKMAREAVNDLFAALLDLYADNEKVLTYLTKMHDDVSENYRLFQGSDGSEENFLFPFVESKVRSTRYQVNVFVDRSKLTGAPVVFETNPSYHNLFGKVEYRGSFGSMSTDFTMIKPGALHTSNGGYLIVQAAELLANPLSWIMLKRTLKTRQIRIENVLEEQALVSTAGIKPEEIPLDVKVVMIGSAHLYHLLAQWDEDFHKIFKVKVEFDTDMEKSAEHIQDFASFVKRYTEESGLLPFHRGALASLMNYSSRLAGDQRKLSTRFHDITKIIVESSFWAEQAEALVVEEAHLRQALDEQEYRSSRIAERIREMIADGTLMVDTEGEVVGQINGLAVLQTGDYMFGQPHRITAQTYLGRKGILNIERETSLSGQLHDKGLLILSGYLNGKFAQERPLPISASVTFEQTYSMIDGDSASSTELYALLSSLSQTGIKQGIAVTGSVNQKGEIQPIGGVNEKIEGFFYVCAAKGLTGEQGVIIPHQNVKNLGLKADVAEAIERGQFHVWSVETIEQGIEMLTGESAETIFARVEQRLNQMFERLKALERKGDVKPSD